MRELEQETPRPLPPDRSSEKNVPLTKTFWDTSRANYLASTQESSKNEPDLSYLPNLRSIITTIHLMLGYIHTVLLPLASSSITIRRQMEKAAQVAVSRTEEKVNGVMQHTVDVIVAWTGKLLQSQKKNDFRPKDGALEGGGSLWLEQLQTPVCPSLVLLIVAS